MFYSSVVIGHNTVLLLSSFGIPTFLWGIFYVNGQPCAMTRWLSLPTPAMQGNTLLGITMHNMAYDMWPSDMNVLTQTVIW